MYSKLRNTIERFWNTALPIYPLVSLRIILGLMLTLSTLRFIVLGWIEDHYLEPVMRFHYFGFEWLPLLPPLGIYLVHYCMLISSILVVLGWKYRIASILLFLSFTYTELLDLTYYLNHYYFVSLACFLLIWVPANRYFSLDAWFRPSLILLEVPAWTQRIFMLQIGIVYFYAGIAKINYDWLMEALPLRIWLPPNNHLPLIGEIFNWKITPYVFSWFGMLYDISIAFWLLWRVSRPWAFITVVVFHTMTGILFQIGVFPLVMIGAALIFFSPVWHQKVQEIISRIFRFKKLSIVQPTVQLQPAGVFLKTALGMYLLFQIVFPWRFLLYPGNRFWTEEGYRFGWRVMLMEKAGTADFFVKDSCTGREGVVFNTDFLNDHQEKQMAMQPDMILQYAHFLKQHYAKAGMCNPSVRAEVYVTLNGKPGYLLIDPHLDLTQIQDSWAAKEWILPMPEEELHASN